MEVVYFLILKLYCYYNNILKFAVHIKLPLPRVFFCNALASPIFYKRLTVIQQPQQGLWFLNTISTTIKLAKPSVTFLLQHFFRHFCFLTLSFTEVKKHRVCIQTTNLDNNLHHTHCLFLKKETISHLTQNIY